MDSHSASWNLTQSSFHLREAGVGVGAGQCELAWTEGKERCSAGLWDSLGQWALHTPGISIKANKTRPCLALMFLVLSGQPENPTGKPDSPTNTVLDGLRALPQETESQASIPKMRDSRAGALSPQLNQAVRVSSRKKEIGELDEQVLVDQNAQKGSRGHMARAPVGSHPARGWAEEQGREAGLFKAGREEGKRVGSTELASDLCNTRLPDSATASRAQKRNPTGLASHSGGAAAISGAAWFCRAFPVGEKQNWNQLQLPMKECCQDKADGNWKQKGRASPRRMCVCLGTRICMDTCMHVCGHMHMRVFAYTYIHTPSMEESKKIHLSP